MTLSEILNQFEILLRSDSTGDQKDDVVISIYTERHTIEYLTYDNGCWIVVAGEKIKGKK